MALTQIKKSTVPVLGKGQIGKPVVAVRSNGQISFSSMVSKILTNCVYAAVGFDEAKRTLQFQGLAKVPKGVDENDLFKLGHSDKTKAYFFSGAGLMQLLSYDYKASGNQSFDAVTKEENKTVVITLPKGKLTPKPVVTRVKKEKVASAAAGANGAAKAPTTPPAAEGDEPELELEEA